ncbi:alpha/beta fold hydrolase [Gellertiella hungarica]|uniref:Lysophospholipase n=1 Tax=Gellertiella hungarica TaxID=1572859 RepID=A0A7W6J2V2_9HYPH|nr:alpha/beta hydrolase [Gellertiella hungarica]MBB4063092.1 lysophospholipase [Gellertiella hungarica]
MDAILHPTPDNPVPDNHFSGYFTGHKGARLRYAVFRSSQPVAKGTVVLLQGRNECIEKYYETIRDLNEQGLWVATFDLRGQGGSDRLLPNRRRGHVRRFGDYEKDLSIFLTEIVLPDTRLPFFLIGHSTGALIALSAAPYLASRIDRMALCAPFVGLSGQGLPIGAIRVLSRTLSLFGLSRLALTREARNTPFEKNVVTSDAVRYARNQKILDAFPDLGIGPPSCRWLSEAFGTMDRVSRPEHLTRITIPTLILAPTMDKLVPYAAQEALARKFRACQLIPIAGSGHEVFQERDIFRAQALGAIAAFMPGSDADENGIGAAL